MSYFGFLKRVLSRRQASRSDKFTVWKATVLNSLGDLPVVPPAFTHVAASRKKRVLSGFNHVNKNDATECCGLISPAVALNERVL